MEFLRPVRAVACLRLRTLALSWGYMIKSSIILPTSSFSENILGRTASRTRPVRSSLRMAWCARSALAASMDIGGAGVTPSFFLA